jgi:hypothetical protein
MADKPELEPDPVAAALQPVQKRLDDLLERIRESHHLLEVAQQRISEVSPELPPVKGSE